MLSAKSSLGDRISGLENGIDDYITKPFSSSYLKARIRSLINQHKELQKWFMSSMLTGSNESLHKSLAPSQPKLVSHDEMFIKQIMAFMESNMENSSLSVNDFSNHLSMSRTVFYKKTKALLGVTPLDFIRDMRV